MRILDAEGRELSERDCDPSLGRLVPDVEAAAHHGAEPPRPEQGHLEWAAFYFEDGTSYEVEGPGDPRVGPGGWVGLPGEGPRAVRGADQRWVVDDPGSPGRDAWDEVERVLRWVPYTEGELAALAEAEAREAALAALPGEQAAQDDALCALYEMCEAQAKTIAEQDDAICAVYEMIGA